ncbi:SCO family protein [Leptospira mtsangambouensis]|uniref:SCO family protein n=1 Tax=Leptospira mtsangambouensis TaxID=2484912 RepID=A0ABY2NX69_9LEPT|nr:SCO family protein [Leptospira mtsangambouensis]TGM72903.1 SCO family protein [Leptospira mtsangambouensis]
MRLLIGFILCFVILLCKPSSFLQNQDNEKLATNFELIDINQNPFRFYEDTQSKSLVVLFFGYSHCPDICLTTLNKFSSLSDNLPEEILEKIQFVYVSIDPKNDDPLTLKKYMMEFSKKIIALTGDAAEIKKIANDYELVLLDNPKFGKVQGEGKILHSTNIYLIQKNHKIIKTLPHQIGLETLKEEILEIVN